MPVLFLIHGSSISWRPSFALTPPGRGEYSMMNSLAQYGFDVWTMDHENYGRSGRTDGNSDIASGVDLSDLFKCLPSGDRQFVILPGMAQSVVFGVNRQRFWHVMHAFLTSSWRTHSCVPASALLPTPSNTTPSRSPSPP
jgi:hypothetical protein